VALSIFRPLTPSLRLSTDGQTPGLICLKHCEAILESCEHYWQMWPSGDYSLTSVFPPFDCAITLLSMLQDQYTHDLFNRACSLLLRHVIDFPFTLFLLHGFEMITARLDLPIPLSAMLSNHGLSPPTGEPTDVPISFILPLHDEAFAGELDSRRAGRESGELFSEWNDHRSQC
jgi:hypothetical protein